MDFDQVAESVDGVPHMRKPAGRRLYDHVICNDLRNVLEIGTSHGVSTCYLAAAVDELDDGRVVTLDRWQADNLDPNVHELLRRTGLGDRVTPVFAARSFTWELRRMLAEKSPPTWDFVFLDAGHTWDVTGLAFFLVDMMLKPGGWLLFDDLNWSITKSPSLWKGVWDDFPQEEKDAQQVRMVFDLLVTGSGRYATRIDGNWGWAQKVDGASTGAGQSASLRRLNGLTASVKRRLTSR